VQATLPAPRSPLPRLSKRRERERAIERTRVEMRPAEPLGERPAVELYRTPPDRRLL